MKYKRETVEITCNISENSYEYSFTNLSYASQEKNIPIPKSFTKLKTPLITEHRSYTVDLGIIEFPTDKKITLTIQISIPVLPHLVPKFIVKALTMTHAISYFDCECCQDGHTRNIKIFTKERFERYNEEREEYIKSTASSLTEQFTKIDTFCPYFIKCISDFKEKTFMTKDGKEISQLKMEMQKAI